ncbi:hypothetical protein [Gelidibacter salicanalis]|uniref:Uncharacterized protein n=1 Tax=Gelidibacter salicanalis TaxID=291193 RepID=A0A934KJ33_9FLAO|nr:hypothetical protein [Gelidibacter salicanalis]MBJ7879952.1 hypothetical protein [Gelidibacter salicanalis]
MKTLLIGIALLGLTILVNSQSLAPYIAHVNLKEVIVSPIKHISYYDAVHHSYAAKGIRNWDTIDTKYDISTSELYGRFDSYIFMFLIMWVKLLLDMIKMMNY